MIHKTDVQLAMLLPSHQTISLGADLDVKSSGFLIVIWSHSGADPKIHILCQNP